MDNSDNINFFYSKRQYGNNIGRGQFRGKALPTYVYPECLKAAIREKLSEGLWDYPNPKTSAVSFFYKLYQLYKLIQGAIAFQFAFHVLGTFEFSAFGVDEISTLFSPDCQEIIFHTDSSSLAKSKRLLEPLPEPQAA